MLGGQSHAQAPHHEHQLWTVSQERTSSFDLMTKCTFLVHEATLVPVHHGEDLPAPVLLVLVLGPLLPVDPVVHVPHGWSPTIQFYYSHHNCPPSTVTVAGTDKLVPYTNNLSDGSLVVNI